MMRGESKLTTRGVELIRRGMALRHVADLLGLAPSTLVRACKRAGLVLPRGRRPLDDDEFVRQLLRPLG
jgi:5-methylthioribose kinase